MNCGLFVVLVLLFGLFVHVAYVCVLLCVHELLVFREIAVIDLIHSFALVS